MMLLLLLHASTTSGTCASFVAIVGLSGILFFSEPLIFIEAMAASQNG
jgi:hypothetical protein